MDRAGITERPRHQPVVRFDAHLQPRWVEKSIADPMDGARAEKRPEPQCVLPCAGGTEIARPHHLYGARDKPRDGILHRAV